MTGIALEKIVQTFGIDEQLHDAFRGYSDTVECCHDARRHDRSMDGYPSPFLIHTNSILTSAYNKCFITLEPGNDAYMRASALLSFSTGSLLFCLSTMFQSGIKICESAAANVLRLFRRIIQ